MTKRLLLGSRCTSRSEGDFAYQDEVHGDLFRQMEQTVELLSTKYMVAWVSYEGLRRVEIYPIPRDAPTPFASGNHCHFGLGLLLPVLEQDPSP